MAKIAESNSRIYGSSDGLFEGGGGLLTNCSSRMGAYSRGEGGFFEGGQFEDLR